MYDITIISCGGDLHEGRNPLDDSPLIISSSISNTSANKFHFGSSSNTGFISSGIHDFLFSLPLPLSLSFTPTRPSISSNASHASSSPSSPSSSSTRLITLGFDSDDPDPELTCV